MAMTGWERIRSVLLNAWTDRIPYSFWTHFPSVDLDPIKLAETTYQFYKKYDLDFIKNMPNGMFMVEDFGCECDFSAIPSGGVAKISKYVIERPADWMNVKEPVVHKGALGRELESLQYLLKLVKEEVPVIVTVFSPLTTAYKLCGPEMISHLRNHPRELMAGLSVIARVTGAFAQEAVRIGCAGVFFANQMATRDQLTEEEYARFGVPYDLQVLQAVQSSSWFNVMHIHGTNIMYNQLLDYPVQAINWHVWETEPSIEAFRQAAPDKVMVGGLQRFHITNGRMKNLRSELREVSRLTNGSNLILTPGCVIRYPIKEKVLLTLRKEIIRHSKKIRGDSPSRNVRKDIDRGGSFDHSSSI